MFLGRDYSESDPLRAVLWQDHSWRPALRRCRTAAVCRRAQKHPVVHWRRLQWV